MSDAVIDAVAIAACAVCCLAAGMFALFAGVSML